MLSSSQLSVTKPKKLLSQLTIISTPKPLSTWLALVSRVKRNSW